MVRSGCLILGLTGCLGQTGGPGALSPAAALPWLACDALPTGEGEGTWYDADGTGACGFDPPDPDAPLLVAAMNAPDWNGSLPCGACARVQGPQGEVVVQIVDLCPECRAGNLDLSPEAFVRLAPLVDGRIPITWALEPCPVAGPLALRVADGSNPYWLAVQVLDHRNPVAAVQVRFDDRWYDLPRADWNHFIADQGLGNGPFVLRAVDVHGDVVVDRSVVLREGVAQAAPAQFAVCDGAEPESAE